MSVLHPRASNQLSMSKQAVHTTAIAAEQKASFGCQLAKATSAASNQRACFDKCATGIKLAAGNINFASGKLMNDMSSKLTHDKLTHDKPDQKKTFVHPCSGRKSSLLIKRPAMMTTWPRPSKMLTE